MGLDVWPSSWGAALGGGQPNISGLINTTFFASDNNNYNLPKRKSLDEITMLGAHGFRLLEEVGGT